MVEVEKYVHSTLKNLHLKHWVHSCCSTLILVDEAWLRVSISDVIYLIRIKVIYPTEWKMGLDNFSLNTTDMIFTAGNSNQLRQFNVSRV